MNVIYFIGYKYLLVYAIDIFIFMPQNEKKYIKLFININAYAYIYLVDAIYTNIYLNAMYVYSFLLRVRVYSPIQITINFFLRN